MECVGLPNREVDSGSMVPLNCTTQGGPVHIVAAFTLAQQDPGTQRTFAFSSPVSLGLASFGLGFILVPGERPLSHSWVDVPNSPRPTSVSGGWGTLIGLGQAWVTPGLTLVAGGLGYCIWQHFQKHGTGKKQFSVFTGW